MMGSIMGLAFLIVILPLHSPQSCAAHAYNYLLSLAVPRFLEDNSLGSSLGSLALVVMLYQYVGTTEDIVHMLAH